MSAPSLLISRNTACDWLPLPWSPMIATLRFGSVEFAPRADGAPITGVARATKATTTAREGRASLMNQNRLGTAYLTRLARSSPGEEGTGGLLECSRLLYYQNDICVGTAPTEHEY